MNKKNIYLLLFIYAILNTYSQTVNVYLSPDINDEDSYPEIIGMNDQSFYVISSKSENEFYIENFTNKELRRIYKRQVEMPKIEGKSNTFENILYFNSHIYLFSSQHDKKLKKYTVYINEVKANGELSLNHTVIDEISFTDKNYFCKYSFSLSSDSNRILAFRESSESESSKGKINYKVISKGLKTVFNKDIELELPLHKVSVSNVFMDDEQNLYYTEKQYLKNESESGDFAKLFVVSFKAEKDSLYKSEISINEKRFLDVNLQFNSQGKLICTGNYAIDKNASTNWEESHTVKGLYYSILESENLKSLSQAQYNIQDIFPEEKFYHYYFTNSFQLDENSLVVLCEFQNTVCDNGNCDSKFGPMIKVNFNLKEKQGFAVQKISSLVSGEKPNCKGGTLSYLSFQYNNTVKLLFNCNKQFEIATNGTVASKPIFDNSSNADLAFMKYSFRMNKEEMLVLTYSKKTGHRFAKFSFKE
jgi:hypothetical protein